MPACLARTPARCSVALGSDSFPRDVSVLRSQIAMTPRGSYRDGLEKHLDETHKHARRIREQLGELDRSRNPVQAFVGFTETLTA
jgi:hypothetical protein